MHICGSVGPVMMDHSNGLPFLPRSVRSVSGRLIGKLTHAISIDKFCRLIFSLPNHTYACLGIGGFMWWDHSNRTNTSSHTPPPLLYFCRDTVECFCWRRQNSSRERSHESIWPCTWLGSAGSFVSARPISLPLPPFSSCWERHCVNQFPAYPVGIGGFMWWHHSSATNLFPPNPPSSFCRVVGSFREQRQDLSRERDRMTRPFFRIFF